MQTNKKFTREEVYDIIAKTKYITLDLDPNSNYKDLLVTTEYHDKINTRADQSFTKFPVVSEIETKMIRQGNYEIMAINKIKGNEEVAIKELIKKSNYNDVFAIAYENKQLLNQIKTKYDFKAIIDSVEINNKKYGLLILSPKLKEMSISDTGLRYQRDLPQGFDDTKRFESWANKTAYLIQDKMRYLKNLQDYAESQPNFKLKDESNAYVKENLSKGKIQEKTDAFYSEKFLPLIQHINFITKKGRVKYSIDLIFLILKIIKKCK